MPPRQAKGKAGGAAGASHRFPGGHSDSPLLPGAVTLALSWRSPSSVEVVVANATVGHNFPTGGAHPSRAVLSIEVRDGASRVLHRDQRVYRSGVDARSAPDTARGTDTTLEPQERRLETFSVPAGGTGREVHAKLVYSLLPEGHESTLPSADYRRHYRPVVIAQARRPSGR